MSSNPITSAIKTASKLLGAQGNGLLANGLKLANGLSAAAALTEGVNKNSELIKGLNPNSPEYYQQLYGTMSKVAQDATAQFAKSQKELSKDSTTTTDKSASDKSWTQKAAEAVTTLRDLSGDLRDKIEKDLNPNNFTNRFVDNSNYKEILKGEAQFNRSFNSESLDKNGKFVDNTIEDADGNAINKNLNYKFHAFDKNVEDNSGLNEQEWQQFNGGSGRLAKDSNQSLINIQNAQQKIENSNNLSSSDKTLLKADGQSLAFIHANKLNTAGTEKMINMLKEDKAYQDHAKENFSKLDSSKGRISQQAHTENTRALKELLGNDDAKLQDTLATLKKHGGIEDLSNFNRRTYDRSAKDMNFMLKDSGDGKTEFQKGVAKLQEQGQKATFDIDIRIGGKASLDSNGSGSNILNGIEHAQKSELKDQIGLVGQDGRNQLTFAFQDVDKAKEFVSQLREQFGGGKEGGSLANIGKINLSLQGHGAEGKSGGFVADSKKGTENITELSKEIGRLAGENGAKEVDFNGNCCGSEAQAEQARSGIKEGVEETNKEDAVQIRSLANDGRSSNDGADLADRQGIVGNKYNADGTTSLDEQWSNGHKGQTNAEKYSTIQKLEFANGNEESFKANEKAESAKIGEDKDLAMPNPNEFVEDGPKSADDIPMPDAKNIDDGANNDDSKRGDDDDDGAISTNPQQPAQQSQQEQQTTPEPAKT